MNCAACGHANTERAKFCAECGGLLAARCTSCGAGLLATAKFCSECGIAVASEKIRPAPRDYTPRHLAERILASKSAVEGERKQVTVFFADVKSSMELAETVD